MIINKHPTKHKTNIISCFLSIGNENNDRNRQKTGQIAPRVNIDEVIDYNFIMKDYLIRKAVIKIMNLINEKLSTGYHGVEHLFKSNDIHKDGRLSK